ncbi:MAG: hypothetical protein ACREOO_02450 [bacterium]
MIFCYTPKVIASLLFLPVASCALAPILMPALKMALAGLFSFQNAHDTNAKDVCAFDPRWSLQ